MFKMKRQWKRIISTIMAALMVVTVIPSSFSSSSAAEIATPGDADRTGYVKIEAKLPESDEKGEDVTGIVYEVYKDASCKDDVVGTFVLSCDGKAYSKDDEPVVYSDKKKVNKKNLSYLELEKGTYYYQMAKNLYKSENAPSDQNVLYDDQIYTFTLSAKANKKKAIVLKPEIIAISQTATPTDAVEDEAATSETGTSESTATSTVESTTEDVATPSDAEPTEASTAEVSTEEVTTLEDTTENSSEGKEVATPDIATTPDSGDNKVAFVEPIAVFVNEIVQNIFLASSGPDYGQDINPTYNWYYKEWKAEMDEKYSSEFNGSYDSCGKYYACAQWVWDYYISSSTVNEKNCLNPTNTLNTASTGAIMSALNSDTSHWLPVTTITGTGTTDASKKANAISQLFSQIRSGYVQAGDIIIFNRNGSTRHIGILSASHREDGSLGIWQSNGASGNSTTGLGKLYWTAIQDGVSAGADGFTVYRKKRENEGKVSVTKTLNSEKGTKGETQGVVLKLFKVADRSSEATSSGSVKIAEFTVNSTGDCVPSLITKTATDMGAVIDGNSISKLPYGVYLMEESSTLSNGKNLSTKNMLKAEHQYCDLSATSKSYGFSFNNKTLNYSYVVVQKKSTSDDLPLEEYNMAGITYKFFETNDTDRVISLANVGDGGSHVSVNQVVLSYNGKAYMDKDGKNIIFTSKKARKNYTGALREFKFYLKNEYCGKKIHVKEASKIYDPTNAKYYYYNENGSNSYANAGKSLKTSGFKLDETSHVITIPEQSKPDEITFTAKDAPLLGKVRVEKRVKGADGYDKSESAKGVTIWLDRKNEDGDWVHVGTYTINKGGAGIPTSVTSAGNDIGIKTNYKGEGIDGSTVRNIFQLPFGTYRLSEHDKNGLDLIYPEKGYYTFSISESNFDSSGNFINKLSKDNGYKKVKDKEDYYFEFDNSGVRKARLSKVSSNTGTSGAKNYYNMAGIRYDIIDEDGKAATSVSVEVSGTNTKKSSCFILSYNGKAYMDENGRNVIFVSEDAKDAYPDELHLFVWGTDLDGATFKYKEAATLFKKGDTGTASAYYYDDETAATKNLIKNHSGNKVADVTGFALDKSAHVLNMGKNTVVDNTTSDTPTYWAKFEIEKGSTRAVDVPSDKYNYAGIQYRIYSTNDDDTKKRVEGFDHIRDDGILTLASDTLVLSYDGHPYLDTKGKNIIFVSADAKKSYMNANKLSSVPYFRWYMHNLTGNVTYYYRELANTFTKGNTDDVPTAYYYDDGESATKSLISKHSGKSVATATGFARDDKFYPITFTYDSKNHPTTLSATASGNPKDKPVFWGKFELQKNPNIPAAADPNYYNMAGIRYRIYNGDKSKDEKASSVTASDHATTEGIAVSPSDTITLSYNGIAYMDDAGNNVVFVSAAAYNHYKNKAKRSLYKYRWYKHNLTADTTYYYHEMSETLGRSGYTNKDGKLIAYYYDDGTTATKNLINAHGGTASEAKKVANVTGYAWDKSYYSFKLKLNSDGTGDDVAKTTTDNIQSAKAKATKLYARGNTSELNGVKFNLHKVSGNGAGYSNGTLVGTFIHNGTSLEPKETTISQVYKTLGVAVGTGTDAAYFTNLPFGWYCLVEDAATAQARGFSVADPVYLEAKRGSTTLNFSMSDERSGLRLRKQYDDKVIGGLCNYSLAEATYEVYKTTANNVASTTEHVCTFTTNASGEGYVSWYDNTKYYALADTRADKHSYKLVGIPIGTWLYIKETKASAGCELDSKAHYLHFTADNMSQTVTSTEPLKTDPISIQISKEDATSSEEAGAASLAGAEFTVKYYDVDVSGTINKDTLYAKVKTMTPTRTWVYKTDEGGLVDMNIPEQYLIANKSNALYYSKNGNPIFPYGAITIEETKAPTGYTKTGKFTTTDNKDKSNADGVIFAVINKDYTTEKFIGTNALIKKEVPLRGDIKFKKVALDTGKPLSGIAFRITSKTTGESHVVVTDENGMIDTAALKHSSNTNAADKDLATVSGTWFYGNKDCKGSVNDSFGALPYDVYEIEELATETNKKYRLITPITVNLTNAAMYTDGYQLYDLGSITNVPEPWIETHAMSTDTEDNVVPANTKVDVKDICSYNYLESGKKYTIKGVIMDPVTEKPLVQADGTYSLGHYTFTVPADETGYYSDSVEIPFTIDTTGLEDRNVVVAEYVFEGEDDSDLTVKEDGSIDTTGVLTTHTSELVAHTDLTATTQTLSVPKIGTTALGVETETHFVLNAGIIKFKDIVDYKNVIPGKTYELSATVMDKDTGKPLLDVDGNEITSSATFTPEDRNGSAEVEFTCDASKVDFRDKAIVLFEDLRYNKITLATHADLTDEGQTLYFPDVTSTLAETETGNKKPFYSKDMKLTDVVTLSNIPKSTIVTKYGEDGNAYNEEAAGAKLTITDILYNKRTKKPVMLGGNEVSETIEVFVSEDDVSYSIDFAFDGTKTDLYNAEDGSIADVVAFVYVYDDKGNLIAKEEELGNVDQTITFEVPKTEVKVNKVWDDADNQDGIRPNSVEVQLYKDNDVAVGKPITLAASNDWSYTWTGLKAEENAETINYYVKEVSIPDEYSCTIVKTDENSFSYTITNTHKPGKTVINVNKIWADSDDQDGIRPESIEVQLYKNGKAFGDAITLSEENGWSYSWTDLDKFESGKEIKYTVDEVKVPENYKKTITNEGTTFEITNTHKAEKTSISVVKVWDDSDDQDGIRPASVKVQLLADGEAVGKVITLSSKNDWSHTWKGLDKMSAGKEIKYTVDEVEVPENYTKTITNEQTAFTITNTHKPEKTKVSVVKVWDDADDQDGFRPTTIKVRLYKDGDALGKIVTLSKDNKWKYTWEDLPKYEAGKEIKYTVDEVSIPSEYTKTVTNEQTAFTITNTHKTRETEISVVKVWDDNNDQDQIRPASIEVKLTADGEQIGDTVKLSEKNEWKYEWKNLPLLAKGKKIKYSVDEVEVPTDYTKTITNKGTKFTITNTHKPGKTSVSVVKVWDDNNDQDGIRPTTIDVRLLADGEPVGEVVELSENNNWTYTWSNLDKQAGDKTITYTVDEVEVPSGYTKTVTNDQTVFTITNTHKPGTTVVKVTKVWKDNNDKYQIRPDSIKVQLYKGEGSAKKKVGEPITLTEKDNWTYTWTDLAKTEDGKDVVYTVDEVEVPSGYKKTVSKDTDSSNITAFIITNSKPDTPKTGDSFRLIPVAILMVAAFVTGVFVWRKKRKNK